MKSNDFRRLCIFLICALLVSCATSSKNHTQTVQDSRRIKNLESDLRKKQASLAQLKEQNWILKQKYTAAHPPPSAQKIPVPFQPSAAQGPSELEANRVPATMSSMNNPEAIATDSDESAEHNLYAKVISSYRQKDSAALKRVSEILLKTYPQSVFADRAIYLNAHLAFETSNDALAMSECEKIIHNYPNAHKLVSTYFLEAQILKKKGRINEARNVLNEIQTFYPGSPEAFRTPVELKLLSLQAKAAM
jgi:TolA-binding protein